MKALGRTGVRRRVGGPISDLSRRRGSERKTSWWGSMLSSRRAGGGTSSLLGETNVPPLASWSPQAKSLEAARRENTRTARGRPLRAARRSGLPLVGATLLMAGIVIAAATILLSNTSKDAATVVTLSGDWNAVATLTDASYLAGVSSGTVDGSVATCGSGECADFTRVTNTGYASAGFTEVDFLIVFSNWTVSDFASLSGTWLPSNDPCVPAIYTNPVQPLISGVGCKKIYTAANFASLPAQGQKGQWELSFTISQTTAKTSLQMFGWAEGQA